MVLAQNDHVIEQLSASAANHLSAIPFCQGLRKAVRRGSTPIWSIISVTRSEKIESLSYMRKRGAVSSGERLAELLHDPGRCRMCGDPEVDDLSSSVADDKPDVQQPEPSGRDDQEVHRGDAVPVIAKERSPPLALIMARISLREISRDSREADRDPKFFEFSLNLSGAPVVLVRKPTNEGLHLHRNGRSTGSVLRNRSPVQPESLAMPSDHGFGPNDDQGLFPSRPELRQKDPEAPVGRSDPGSASPLCERGELLTKGEFNDHLLVSASKESRNTAKEDRQEFEQVPRSEGHSARRHCSIRD